MTVPRIADSLSLIDRPALIKRIQQVTSDQFVIIYAPAGYGKTALAAKAAATLGGRTAWLALDEHDNDPDLFLAYLIAALDPASLENRDRAPLPPGVAIRLATLEAELNLLSANDEPTTLVLDDYHRITNPVVHQLVEQLISFRSPQLRLIISSRSRPPLPLARARAGNELIELQTGNLRFNRQETARALSLLQGTLASDAVTSEMHIRTEGWPIALRLLLLPSGDRQVAYWAAEPEASARDSGNSHVAEYLVEEVLRGLPESYRAFLMYTAPLRRMTASLCNAVTGMSDGQEVLDALELHGLPLFRTNDDGLWYRYHPLVAEVFRQRLTDWYDQDHVAGLHRQASGWFAAHGYLPDSIEHARESQDWDRMIELMHSAGFESLGTGDLQSLWRWLAALPPERRDSDIELSFWYGSVLAAIGQVDQSRSYYDQIESTWLETGNHKMIGEVLKHRAFQAVQAWQLEDALSSARRSYEVNLETTPADRSESLFTESMVYSRMGRVRDALEAHEAAESEYPLPQVTYIEYGWLLAQAGRMSDAEEALRFGLNFPNPVDPHRRGNIWLAEIYRAWGDFPRAEEALDRAAEIKFRQHTPPSFPWLSIARAKLHWSATEPEEAIAELDRGLATMRRNPRDPGFRVASAVKATLLFMQESTDDACAIANELVEAIEREDHRLFLDEQLMRARYLIATERPETALSYLTELSRAADSDGRVIDRGRILIVKSLAWEAVRRKEAAARDLYRAVTLLEPSRHFTAFSDEGTHLISSLRSIAVTGRSLEFVREIVNRSSSPLFSPSAAMPGGALIDPLSRRELEVLRLVSVGLSNREISDQLFISVPTVKRHISTIFQKLDATSRTGAVSAARARNMI